MQEVRGRMVAPDRLPPRRIDLRGRRIPGAHEAFLDDAAITEIDAARRQAIRRNHTATHLLHRALREVLGPDTHQAGSLVAPDRLRFDFSSLDAVAPEQLRKVAEIVNQEIVADLPVSTETKPYEEAVATGAMALFGEKYGDVVRVVTVPGFSEELCGGTHVARTGEIGRVAVTDIEKKGKQNRRVRIALA